MGLGLYSRNQAQNKDDVVQRYLPLVKKVALHLQARLPPNVQLDDLVQSGMIGLLEALGKYDASKGAAFETYATIRIRGAMLDEIRRYDWAPRSVHRNGRRIAEAIKAIEARTNRDARDVEIAQELGISLQEYNNYLNDCASSRLFSFDEITQPEEGSFDIADPAAITPSHEVENAAFQQHLAEAIATLPEREQLVLALYYNEGMNLKEIGAVLTVGESRVSQIHSQAAMRLRARLADWC